MIKVLHILTDTNIGGAGTLLVNYLKNFDREKFLIKVILPMGSLMKPRVEALGYEVIETKNLADKSMDVKGIFELMKIFKAEKPDIVHTHSSMSGKIAAYLTGVKSRIYTRHCAYDPPGYLTAFPGKQLNGFVNNTLSTQIVAVAEAAKENLTDTGVDERKITVIINGVEPLKKYTDEEIAQIKAEFKVPEGYKCAAIVARLNHVKGHKYFVEAAKHLKDMGVKAKLLIAGTGDMEEPIKSQITDLGLEDDVIMLGFLTNVEPLMNVIDVQVNCSFGTEATSLSLLEGMSLGKPAVVTDFGGNPGVIKNSKNGYLVPTHNSFAVAEKLKTLFEDKELYDNMSKTSKEIFDATFTAEKYAENIDNIYINLGGKNNG